MSDEIRRAYATLGLQPGAAPAQIKKQHRSLVRRWHPDRFAADPVGQAEAAQRMSQINQAYRLLLEAQPAAAAPPEPPVPPSSSPSGAHRAQGFPHSPRLSREQIDRIVASIGADSPVDAVMQTFGRMFERFRVGCSLIAAMLLVTIVASRWANSDVAVVLQVGVLVAFLIWTFRSKKA
jgi:curved DNA-binding protein CbpA